MLHREPTVHKCCRSPRCFTRRCRRPAFYISRRSLVSDHLETKDSKKNYFDSYRIILSTFPPTTCTKIPLCATLQ